MNNPNTSEWTMGDRPKKSVPQTIKDIEMQTGGLESRLAKLEKWRVGDPDLDRQGVDDLIKNLYFYFAILWKVACVIGVIFMALFSWILTKV